MKTVDFSETVASCDLKIGRCRQLIRIMKVCEYSMSRSFLYHIFSRFRMSCALLGQDISGALQDHWFFVCFVCCFLLLFFFLGGGGSQIIKF